MEISSANLLVSGNTILAWHNVMVRATFEPGFYAFEQNSLMFAVVRVSDYNLSKPRAIQEQARRTN